MTPKFERTGQASLVQLTTFESTLLQSLTEQVCELLEGEADTPQDADPFVRWQAELSADDPLDRSDPVINRLFPEAYPDDPLASAEFRRLTQGRQRADRLSQANTVLQALVASNGGKHRVLVPDSELDDWLRTITAVRLSLAVRLGIKTSVDIDDLEALPEADPSAYVYQVYEWLAYLMETLISLAEEPGKD